MGVYQRLDQLPVGRASIPPTWIVLYLRKIALLGPCPRYFSRAGKPFQRYGNSLRSYNHAVDKLIDQLARGETSLFIQGVQVLSNSS